VNEPLELLKVEQALRSENMKLDYRRNNKPSEINILDYTVIAALEKQIPEKPAQVMTDSDMQIGNFVFHEGTKIYSCICGKWIGYRDSFCKHCGQKLDWEPKIEEEE
jgi:hypothetical protein